MPHLSSDTFSLPGRHYINNAQSRNSLHKCLIIRFWDLLHTALSRKPLVDAIKQTDYILIDVPRAENEKLRIGTQLRFAVETHFATHT